MARQKSLSNVQPAEFKKVTKFSHSVLKKPRTFTSQVPRKLTSKLTRSAKNCQTAKPKFSMPDLQKMQNLTRLTLQNAN